jgi:hypothetical protein
MTAIAPDTFAPPALEPDALIEEARRRARHRRLAFTAAALALLAGAVLLVVLVLAGGRGTAGVKPPPGFTVVNAKGPVAHAVLHEGAWKSTSLATGEDRPAKLTEEIWYDRRSGLWRDVFRIDGRIKSDIAGRCRATPDRLPCASDIPLSYLRPYPWPPTRTGYLRAGRGVFRGQDVIWLKPRAGLQTNPNMAVPHIGLDPQTRRTVVERFFLYGRPSGALFISQKPDLPAAHVSFLVPSPAPVPVAPNALFDPWSGLVHGYGFPAARKALQRAPLWLGARFHGLFLRSVTSGAYRPWTEENPGPRSVPFARFYYSGGVGKGSVIAIDELGSLRPSFQKEGPRPGFIERSGANSARLRRDGLLLRVVTDLRRFPLTRANAIGLANALRPLPRGLRTLPTLHEQ